MNVVVIEEKLYKELINRLTNLINLVDNSINPDKEGLSEWLNGEEACALLKISSRTLLSHRRKGIISYSLFNNKIYYKKSDIEQLINESKK